MYTARLEFSPTGDWAIKPKDHKESYAGKLGKGWMMATEVGYNAHDTEVTVAAGESARWKDTLVVGAESVLHLDELSALVEYRWMRQTTNTDIGEPTNNANVDIPRFVNIFVLQAGYALPCPLIQGAVVEPVARFTNMDYNRGGRDSDSFGSGEYGAASVTSTATSLASGNQYDLGVNWYPSAGVYNNKVSLLWTHWLGEENRGNVNDSYKPKADIVRVQYQWLF